MINHCELCEKEFSTFYNLTRHWLTNKTCTYFNCVDCGKRLTSFEEKRKHDNVHHKRRIVFKCHFCKKRFSTQLHLDRHLKKNEWCRFFDCPFCGLRCKSFQAKRKHFLAHNLPRVRVCDFPNCRFHPKS